MERAALRILFAAPAWWPAVAFGGPIQVTRELSERLAAHGHGVSVLTTTLVDLHTRAARRTRTETHGGVEITYLATPVSYRWMGITPSLPFALGRIERPDVVHVLGFRDPISTGVATWARARRIPYVFEPLGMFEPRLRKVALKRGLDATLYRGVAARCGGRRRQLGARGRPRPGGRPGGRPRARARQRLSRSGVDASGRAASCAGSWPFPTTSPIVLYVGRIASGKGIEHLLAVARELTDVHLVLVGPDDRHGAIDEVRAAATSGRVHALGATTEPPLHLYAEADVLCLPSAGESFGMAAAEAAAAGTPVVVTDRCGIAGFFREGEAIVVPYGAEELTDAVRSVLGNGELRRSLAAGGVAAARRMSWEHVTAHQEEIYREAIASRQASTKFSTDGS